MLHGLLTEEQLATLDPGSHDFFEAIGSFVDAAGKEGAAKRERLRMVAELATQFFRRLMVALCQQEFHADEVMNRSVSEAVSRWPGDAESAAACVERCIQVREHVGASANQALIIESFLCDLGRLVRGEMLV